MKLFAICLVSILLQSVNAASYGLFKFTVNPPSGVVEEVVFLLNSQGEIKVLDNPDYFKINSDYFFGELNLRVVTGGDEDNSRGAFKLVNNKLVDGCAAFIDYKNEYGEAMAPRTFNLQRWNKYRKKYENAYSKDFIFSEACFEVLLSDYSDYSFF